jgi:hypothetical protein
MELERVAVEMLFLRKLRAAASLTTFVGWHELGKRDVGWTPDRTGARGRENPEISAA